MRREKNGAHKHRSLFSKNFASKYSRHVVFCKYSQKKNKKNKTCSLGNCVYHFLFFEFEQHFFRNEEEEKKKENGAHKHRSLFSKTSASKYSRHVVLCKNIIKQNKKTNKYGIANATPLLSFGFFDDTALLCFQEKKTEHTNISPLL